MGSEDKKTVGGRTILKAEPMSPDEMLELSKMLNELLADETKFPKGSAGEWFKMFSHVDDDGSGKITFEEFSGATVACLTRARPHPRAQARNRAARTTHHHVLHHSTQTASWAARPHAFTCWHVHVGIDMRPCTAPLRCVDTLARAPM